MPLINPAGFILNPKNMLCRQSKAIVDFPFTNVPRKCSTTMSTRLVSPCNTHNDDERSIIIRWDLYENSFR